MRISDCSSDVCSSDLLGVSKNSVVGKAHRMKLQARPSPIKRGSAPQVRRVAVAAIMKSAQQPPAAPKPVEARVAAQDPAQPPARPVAPHRARPPGERTSGRAGKWV